MKIVVNKCFGGFGLSPIAIKEYLKLKGKEAFFYIQSKYKFRGGINEYKKVLLDERHHITYVSTKDLGDTTNDIPDDYYFSIHDIKRTDVDLVKVVETLGDKANDWAADLRVVEIPDDVKWEIDEYDGIETVHEVHRSW